MKAFLSQRSTMHLRRGLVCFFIVASMAIGVLSSPLISLETALAKDTTAKVQNKVLTNQVVQSQLAKKKKKKKAKKKAANQGDNQANNQANN